MRERLRQLRRLAARRPAAWSDRLDGWSWRSTVVSAALGGTMLVSAAAGWAVRDALREQRRTADAQVAAYAQHLAETFARDMTALNIQVRVRAWAAVLGASAYGGELTLRSAAAAADPVLRDEVGYATDPWRGFFRLDVRTGRYEALERAAEAAVEPIVRRLAVEDRAVLDTAGVPLRANVDVHGEPVTFIYTLHRDRDGRAVALYGNTAGWRSSGSALAASAARQTLRPMALNFFNPSVAVDDATRLDTLVALWATDREGRVLFRTPVRFVPVVAGAYQPTWASAVYRAGLHPALAARLRGGTIDDDRRRLQVALPILALVLGAATILHLRRERELVRARRDFVASVSHELRTPLAQIRMFSETLLLGREESAEERMRWTAIIGREARRLGDLVENILLFSHIDAARVRLEPERTDLGELVEEAVEAYVPLAESRRMRIVADAPSRIYAMVDPRALRQVVVNLLDNALKYGPVGQTVTVEVERDGAEARLAVADEGPGVPAADRVRLWQPFVRLGTAGSSTGGSGIGLSVVRSLVAQHGGTVDVDDAPGGGARFVVTLPLASAPPFVRRGPMVATGEFPVGMERGTPAGSGRA